MKQLIDTSEEFDTLALRDQLIADGNLEAVGGDFYLAMIGELGAIKSAEWAGSDSPAWS